MAYELRLSRPAAEAIEEYVSRLEEPEVRIQAIVEIHGQLERLAENPHQLGTSSRTAFPFPLFQFAIRLGGVTRYFRVAFFYTEDEQAIAVVGFKPLDL